MAEARAANGLRAATLQSDAISVAMWLTFAACAWLGAIEHQVWALNLVRFYVWAIVLPLGVLLMLIPMTKSSAEKMQDTGVLTKLISRCCTAVALLSLVLGGSLLTAAALLAGLVLLASYREAVLKVLAKTQRGGQ